MKITLTVPENYKNSVPVLFTDLEVALALDLGILCVQHVKAKSMFDVESREGGQLHIIGVVRDLLNNRASAREIELESRLAVEVEAIRGVMKECDTLRAHQSASISEMQSIDNVHKASMAQLQLSCNEDMAKRCIESNREANIELQLSRGQLTTERAAHETAVANKDALLQEQLMQAASAAKKAADVQAEMQTQLKTLNDKYARLQIPSERGSLAENNICTAVKECGIHSINTSKGNHNTKFHDLLLSLIPLTPTIASDGRPLYSGDGARLSVESKKYTSSGGLLEQIEAFSRVRTNMISTNRADCFLFVVSGAQIPGKPRFKLELTRTEGHTSITGYLGATDINQREISQAALAILLCQLHIQSNSRLRARPQNEVLAELETISASLVNELRGVLFGVDETLRALAVATNAANTTRIGLVSSLLSSSLQLKAAGVDTENNSDVADAVDSLQNGDCRLRTCKIIRNKDEYKRLSLTWCTHPVEKKQRIADN